MRSVGRRRLSCTGRAGWATFRKDYVGATRIDYVLQAASASAPLSCSSRVAVSRPANVKATRSRSHVGALLLGYYTDDGRLRSAGCAGTGMTDKELKRLAGVLAPL